MNVIEEVIYPVLKDMKEEYELDFELSPDLKLFGKNAALDSLALVSLIVELEAAVSSLYGAEISIANENSMSATESPFKTVKSLGDYVTLLIEESR